MSDKAGVFSEGKIQKRIDLTYLCSLAIKLHNMILNTCTQIHQIPELISNSSKIN